MNTRRRPWLAVILTIALPGLGHFYCGKKIRAAELGRYPYMLVVGDREVEAGEVSVRSHEDGELGSMDVGKFCMLLDT